MIPDQMTHIAHGSGGPAYVMTIATGPVPVPQPGEVLIRVAYAGVNRPDVAQRAGSYPPPPGASPLLGLEVSGRIVALGDDSEAGDAGWAIGDEVCALCNGGGYAQYVAVPVGQILPVPDGMDLLQAAALPENLFTVWTNVIERGRLKAGETFLVHGGSSGIGLTAIQMAKAWGATVYTTVGGDDKAQACLAAGADAAILYKTQDFVAEIAALTGKRGVDVILDMVGGDYIARNLRSLALDGRLVQIAFLQGPKAQVDFTALMTKRLTYTGSTLRPRSASDKAAMARDLRAQIWPRIARGEIKPVIHEVFDLADAAAAHALMESSTHIGKIMLKVD